MLGRVADAEDVVQEAWLRWSAADRSDVREPRGYLVRITTRLAIDRLRQVQSRREAYVGPWLPEPYVTDFGAHRPGHRRAGRPRRLRLPRRPGRPGVALAAGARGVRAARGLRLSRTPRSRPCSTAPSRRSASSPGGPAGTSRSGSPRYEVDPAERRDLTERFLAAAAGGDLDGAAVPAGPRRASRRRQRRQGQGAAAGPARRADKVGRFLVGVAPARASRTCRSASWSSTAVPRRSSLSGGKPDSVFQLDVADGRIQCVYIVRNPDKLLSPDAWTSHVRTSDPRVRPAAGSGAACASRQRTPCERSAGVRSAACPSVEDWS